MSFDFERGFHSACRCRSERRTQGKALREKTLPTNPNNFRFAGVDGRGKQYLVQNPNSNNGVAVIRIEDNRGSMHGYTGDIMWNGGSNNGGMLRLTGTRGTEPRSVRRVLARAKRARALVLGQSPFAMHPRRKLRVVVFLEVQEHNRSRQGENAGRGEEAR